MKSPIGGRVSRQDVTVGNLVATDSTVLTNIVSVDPIYAYADVDERTVLAYQKLEARGEGKGCARYPGAGRRRAGGRDRVSRTRAHRFRGQPDQRRHRHAVHPRASSPTPTATSCSGMFVRMQIPVSGEEDALLITGPRGRLRPGAEIRLRACGDGKVDQRPVTLGPVVDGLRVVTQGLKPDDQVIINRHHEGAARQPGRRPTRAAWSSSLPTSWR